MNYSPPHFCFQWHITNLCNYRCTHCYQKDFQDKGLSLSQLLYILEQMTDFVKTFRVSNKRFRAHINITGGEPFLREDVFRLLECIVESGFYSFGILSNGYIANDEALKKIKELKPKFIQISLEGPKEINDSIRGEGTYDSIVNSIQRYNANRIPVILSFTANKLNFRSFPEAAALARKLKVRKIWSDRYLPTQQNDPLVMSTADTKELFQLMLKEKKKKQVFKSGKTEIGMSRALQFLVGGGKAYSCSAGRSLLAIDTNGDLLPCKRMPVKLGNLTEDSIKDLYLSSQFVNSLQSGNNLNEHCNKCHYGTTCNGGLKCLSYIITSNPFEKDPDCWI